ncbi:hypothetical protein C0Q70_19183 [Pomacea canaliculata]|uniref:Uncharacterized protein n=1 Tax=Pomacea canaliculata TaxID=400727 RepID=A0A2T7NIL4_POMCA|nr:hypothetical protein C0Q70_19183 [Pomacea canaliculata]
MQESGVNRPQPSFCHGDCSRRLQPTTSRLHLVDDLQTCYPGQVDCRASCVPTARKDILMIHPLAGEAHPTCPVAPEFQAGHSRGPRDIIEEERSSIPQRSERLSWDKLPNIVQNIIIFIQWSCSPRGERVSDFGKQLVPFSARQRAPRPGCGEGGLVVKLRDQCFYSVTGGVGGCCWVLWVSRVCSFGAVSYDICKQTRNFSLSSTIM